MIDTAMIDLVGIEFRSFAGEQLACLRGGLPVWQAILVGQAHEMDEDKTAAHLQITVEQVRGAFVNGMLTFFISASENFPLRRLNRWLA